MKMNNCRIHKECGNFFPSLYSPLRIEERAEEGSGDIRKHSLIPSCTAPHYRGDVLYSNF